MTPILQMIVTIFCSVIASSGMWAFIMKKMDSRDAKSKMIKGLGHDRIVALCGEYISRGWITRDEYENLHDYLFEPYIELGGNGTAKRMMAAVEKLPIKRGDAQ